MISIFNRFFHKTPLLFLLIILASTCFAEEIVVNIKAENLKYDELGFIKATGSVEAKFEGVLINADSMIVDVETNVITAEGNVRLSDDNYSARGTGLIYDASNSNASLSDFSTIYTSKDIKGEVFLTIEKFYDEPEKKWGLEGCGTTCDYSDPHYEIKAKSFVFYPQDKIVGHSVTFYINGIPVMWFPVWIYSFRRGRSSLTPVIGHNEVEGDFAKFGFDYFMDNSAYGTVYVDIMQKKGLGKGFEHLYKVNDKNVGVFYFYHLEERDTLLNDWVLKVDHLVEIDDKTKFNFVHKYLDIYKIPSGRFDQTYSKLQYNHDDLRNVGVTFDLLDDRYGGYEKYNLRTSHKIENYETSLDSSFSIGKFAPRYIRTNHRLSHRQPIINDRWTFSSLINFSRNAADADQPFDERLEPQIELVNREDDYTLRIFQNWYIDPDRDIYQADSNNEYLERQPEVTLALKSRDMNYFTLNTSFGVARFHEVRWINETSSLRHFTTDRYNSKFTATKTIPVGFGSRLSLLGGIEQYLYAPGDARYVLNEEIDLRTDLWNFFSNSASYKRGMNEGNTPFYFDIVGVDHEYCSDTVTLYYQNYIRWVTSCGYNFRTDLYNDLLTTLSLRPHPMLEGSASTGYDINNELYKDLILRTTVRPLDRISWSWDSVHDINLNLFKSANSVVRAEIGNDWRNRFNIEFRHSYDYFVGKFILRDLSIVKDLHCWEARFVYSDWLKEWRLSFTLLAFPNQPVGWGSGERGYFFEGISSEQLMDEIRQPSPIRY